MASRQDPCGFGAVRQVGYLCTDMHARIRAWQEQLGVGPWTLIRNVTLHCEYRGEPSRPVIDVGLAYRGDLQIELIQPRNDAPSPYREPLQRGITGVHHIAHLCDDIDADVERALASGMRMVCDIRQPAGDRYVYLDSAALGDGVLIELLDNNAMQQAMVRDGIAAAREWDGKPEIVEVDYAALQGGVPA